MIQTPRESRHEVEPSEVERAELDRLLLAADSGERRIFVGELNVLVAAGYMEMTTPRPGKLNWSLTPKGRARIKELKI